MNKYKIDTKQIQLIDEWDLFKSDNLEDGLKELYNTVISKTGFYETFSEFPSLNPYSPTLFFSPFIKYEKENENDVDILFFDNKIKIENKNLNENRNAKIIFNSFLQQGVVGIEFCTNNFDENSQGEVNLNINKIKLNDNYYYYNLKIKWKDYIKLYEYTPIHPQGKLIGQYIYTKFENNDYIYKVYFIRHTSSIFVYFLGNQVIKRGGELSLTGGCSEVEFVIPPQKSYTVYKFSFGFTPVGIFNFI